MREDSPDTKGVLGIPKAFPPHYLVPQLGAGENRLTRVPQSLGSKHPECHNVRYSRRYAMCAMAGNHLAASCWWLVCGQANHKSIRYDWHNRCAGLNRDYAPGLCTRLCNTAALRQRGNPVNSEGI